MLRDFFCFLREEGGGFYRHGKEKREGIVVKSEGENVQGKWG